MSKSRTPKVKRERKTKTSSFGTPGRRSHDASEFYNSKLYEDLPKESKVKYKENRVPQKVLDTVLNKSAEAMDDLPKDCIHLMVTSPPYNVGKEYDEDLSLDDYRGLLRRVLKEVYRVLVPGGRACVNVANLGRKPYLPLHQYIIEDMVEIGYLMRGEIIWDKGSSASPSTAWGSWLSASNPTLRDVHEYILVFSKESFRREKVANRESSITRDEFLEYTKSVWSFPAVSARSVGHPAPFPVELPRRLIQLYTYEGEVLLDPFAGSGSACLAAIMTKRHFVAYEVEEEYVRLSNKRILEVQNEQMSLWSGAVASTEE